ncbi:camp-dependent protein kinase catalytic subunit [Geranomyces variabilis]|nr:camp-dependent protein kinase catalytic subunit [Geranomyces variabilis]
MAPQQITTTSATEVFFDDRALTYDTNDFHPALAQILLSTASPTPGQSILDLATGTGLVAIAAAKTIGPTGHVTAIDISSNMLAVAKEKAAGLGLTNIVFLKVDAKDMATAFPQYSFDHVLCSAGMVFTDDLPTVFSDCYNFLKIGGKITFDAPADESSLIGSTTATVARHYGIELPYTRLGTPQKCTDATSGAGFEDVDVKTVRFEGSLVKREMLDQAWDRQLMHPLSKKLTNLEPMELKTLKGKFLERLEASEEQAVYVHPTYFLLDWRMSLYRAAALGGGLDVDLQKPGSHLITDVPDVQILSGPLPEIRSCAASKDGAGAPYSPPSNSHRLAGDTFRSTKTSTSAFFTTAPIAPPRQALNAGAWNLWTSACAYASAWTGTKPNKTPDAPLSPRLQSARLAIARVEESSARAGRESDVSGTSARTVKFEFRRIWHSAEIRNGLAPARLLQATHGLLKPTMQEPTEPPSLQSLPLSSALFRKADTSASIDQVIRTQLAPPEQREAVGHPIERAVSVHQRGPFKYELGDFALQKALGQGAFAKVYLVKRNIDGRLFALKSMRKDNVVKMQQVQHGKLNHISCEDACRCWSASARTVLTLHPVSFQQPLNTNTVQNERHLMENTRNAFLVGLEATFQDSQHIFMIIDYMSGGDLFGQIQRFGHLSEELGRFYATEVAMALSYLHSQNIVYRDLKPENVLLDDCGHVKLEDFGFAKVIDGTTRTFCGTPSYIPPEVLLQKEYSSAVDWWSFGVLLFEMLSGCSPFQADTAPHTYERILAGQIQWMPSRRDYFSEAAEDLILGLLVSSPVSRLGCQSESEIRDHAFFASVNWRLVKMRKQQRLEK